MGKLPGNGDIAAGDLPKPSRKFGIRNCDKCEAGIVLKLGADEARTGTVTCVNRTEYTLLIRILDAHTGSTTLGLAG